MVAGGKRWSVTSRVEPQENDRFLQEINLKRKISSKKQKDARWKEEKTAATASTLEKWRFVIFPSQISGKSRPSETVIVKPGKKKLGKRKHEIKPSEAGGQWPVGCDRRKKIRQNRKPFRNEVKRERERERTKKKRASSGPKPQEGQ